MTISVNTVWEVRNGGADTNGGGFVTGASGTDWSQQNAAQYSVTDAVTAGTTTITSATAAFGTDVVGNILYIQGGTGSITAGWYEIVSRTNSTTVVVDRSTGLTAGTGATLKIGGALATPGGLGQATPNGGNKCFLKYDASPYTLTNGTPNTSGGPFKADANISGGILWLVGYDSTRTVSNRDANRPTITVPAAAVTNIKVVDVTSFTYNVRCSNIIVDGDGRANITGFASTSPANGPVWFNCKAIDCVTGFSCGRYDKAILCESVGHSDIGIHGADDKNIFFYCTAHDGTGHGFGAWYGTYIRCMAWNNSGSKDGFNTPGGFPGGYLINCNSVNNGRAGFLVGNTDGKMHYLNCIASRNGTWGWDLASAETVLYNCAGYLNASGNVTGSLSGYNNGFITLTADPFTDYSTGDFTLNDDAGGGADLRAAGLPSSFPGGTTDNFLDVGASQHEDSGGGGSLAVVLINT